MNKPTIPMGDLQRQYTSVKAEIDAAVARVLQSGWYILGPEVSAFEQQFADYCGVQHCIGVACGTDALYLSLAALDVGPSDEVITVANAGIYQVQAILQTGACAVFVDVDPETCTMSPQAFEAAITPATRVVLPVHLYGRMADMPAIAAIAAHHNLAIVEDAAQAHGAWLTNSDGQQRRAGAWGTCGCFSFYPSKNLGALGDGGAIVTRDTALADRLRRLRQYGWKQKYVTTEHGGRNSRLDELQAAILRIKLPYLDAWNAARRERAAWYGKLLSGTSLGLPTDCSGHVYHLYVVTSEQRDSLREQLNKAGIGNDVHYPVPAHMQAVYRRGRVRPFTAGMLPNTEMQAERVLSLPLFPELSRAEVEYVASYC